MHSSNNVFHLTSQPEYSEWDDFGDDVYAIPEVPPVQSSNPNAGAPPTNIADEESKIKALIDTPALDCLRWDAFCFSCVIDASGWF